MGDGVSARPRPTAARLQVFPFFNEGDVLEVRLREHDAVVDVFVPIEGTLTHSGSPKPLHWRDNLSSEPRFARFLPLSLIHI